MTPTSAAEALYRDEYGRILATLIRILGGFDLAEEVAQEAFATALEKWPRDGVPDNPRAWVIGTARHRAIDKLRRRTRFEEKRHELAALAALAEEEATDAAAIDTEPVADDRLRLIFTCCHPALNEDAQVGLTLRTLCGLTTEEIARAFLVPQATMAQRLVRAKKKIRDAGIPYRVPPPEVLPERVRTVAATVYLVFNEGYSASAGAALVRTDLCKEAIRLGELLHELMPGQAEVTGLLALMLLHDARRSARTSNGELVLLEAQDRNHWDRAQIERGLTLVRSALESGQPGPYALQSAIAACHAEARRAEDTDWRQIAGIYAILGRLYPSPVVELNRAVAVAMRDGPAEGLQLLDALAARGSLPDYYLLHSARADLLRRLDRSVEAANAYRRALQHVTNDAERRFLEGRLALVTGDFG